MAVQGRRNICVHGRGCHRWNFVKRFWLVLISSLALHVGNIYKIS